MPQPPKPLQPGKSVRDWLGAELRARREQRHWTQRELAEKLHVSTDVVRKVETADRVCQPDLAKRLDGVLETGGLFERLLILVRAEADNQRAEADKGAEGPSQDLVHPREERMLAGITSPHADRNHDPVDRRLFLAVSSLAAFAPARLPQLVAPTEPTQLPATVHARDIDQIQHAAGVMAGWDHHYGGGGMVRDTAVVQLQWAAALLECDVAAPLRKALFAAVARLGMVVGASAFDSYCHADARRAFRFAAQCADEAGDWHLRAKIFSFRARQEIWTGNPDEGLTFAEIGLARADRLTATERAMLHTARARAFAKMGRVQDTLSAVGAADEAFAHARPDEDPPWMAYYDEPQHQGDTAHALYDLVMTAGHHPTRARCRLQNAVAGHGDAYARARAFSQTKLASLLMATGDPREATAVGNAALGGVGRLHSRRVADEIRELGRLTTRYPKDPEVTALRARVAATVPA